jgi:hypothetical protein
LDLLICDCVESLVVHGPADFRFVSVLGDVQHLTSIFEEFAFVRVEGTLCAQRGHQMGICF